MSGTSTVQVINPSLPHDDYGPQVNACIWALSGMAGAWLVLRIYCKFIRHRRLWWDDYILVASWLMLLGGNISITLAIQDGFGKHSWDIPFKNYPSMLFVSAFAGTFMIIGAAWSKTAFAVTLLRISTGWQKSFIWFIIVSVNAVLGASAVMTWARCWPVEKLWMMSVAGECWSYKFNVRYNIFTAGYSGLMDITLAIIPWHILWGLSIDRKEKFSALGAMSMGIFAGITSFVKIYAIQDSGNADIADTVQLVVLATAEIAVTIIAASIPILRALARDKVPRAGPFLALDETEHWTRQQITTNGTTTTAQNSPPPLPNTPRIEDIELRPISRKKSFSDKLKVGHLSRIQEFDEAAVVQRSPRRSGWTPV
ncbi:hypothetical protein PFICI_10640 [Pestalotiopsis fici W106-1]|uniref:Rhodopsin domain-containing protein n=1 Tax=Pestalotiopsis fici (strain W106-1 / CGMCC3.15140) TaxID=1229662 RepID=W3WXI1_PESFW|nr:uncharacterized protein PFICI_10640 [Pestalotiopsis fici W106-1]ETS78578.1 hypothetical protein PFICI_10640 [Pestalotiopsis fici W106-1]